MATLPKHRDALINVSCVLFVGLIVAFFGLFFDPPRRGFFCDDDSIKYPLVINQTVPNLTLVVSSFLCALVVILAVESVRIFESSSPRDSWPSMTVTLLKRLVEVYGIFLLGAGLNQVTVDVGKFSIGRLRPHFLAACKLATPVCNSTSNSNYNLYITEYECTGDSGIIHEARLSFPSGHAALSFFVAVFLSLFLQHRLTGRSVRLPRHLLQALLLLLAWFTALSRVHDYLHHPTDVLAGLVIGTVWAVLMTTFVIDLKIDKVVLSTKDELPNNRTSPNHIHGLNNV